MDQNPIAKFENAAPKLLTMASLSGKTHSCSKTAFSIDLDKQEVVKQVYALCSQRIVSTAVILENVASLVNGDTNSGYNSTI